MFSVFNTRALWAAVLLSKGFTSVEGGRAPVRMIHDLEMWLQSTRALVIYWKFSDVFINYSTVCNMFYP